MLIDPSGYFGLPPIWLPFGALGIPWSNNEFSISGIPADLAYCSQPGLTRWLDPYPMSGVVEYGTADDLVDVVLDSTGVGPGVYDGTLCLETNDPLNPVVDVSLTLEVTTGAYLPLVFRD